MVLSTQKELLTQELLLMLLSSNSITSQSYLEISINVSGSDTAQIGWVEVTTEAGTSGYLWYLKSEHEARIRFEDQLRNVYD